MTRWLLWAALAVVVALAAGIVASPALDAAQQPLPTPRGQLGGKVDIDDVPAPGVVVSPVPPPIVTPAPVLPGAPSSSGSGGLPSTASPASVSVVRVTAFAANQTRTCVGWVWEGADLVVTAAPLVDDAERVSVADASGRTVAVAVALVDGPRGVAVLKPATVSVPPGARENPTTGRSLAAVETGDRVAAVAPRIGSAGAEAPVMATIEGSARPAPGSPPWLIARVENAGGDWPADLAGAPVVRGADLVGMALPASALATSPVRSSATPDDAAAANALGAGFVVPIDVVAAVVAEVDGVEP